MKTPTQLLKAGALGTAMTVAAATQISCTVAGVTLNPLDPAGSLESIQRVGSLAVEKATQGYQLGKKIVTADDKKAAITEIGAAGVKKAQEFGANYTTDQADRIGGVLGSYQLGDISAEHAFQGALNARDCNAGRPDGIIGQGTRDADARLEAANGGISIPDTAAAVASAKYSCTLK